MKFRINYIQFSQLQTFINSLLYLFPNQKDNIIKVTERNFIKTIDVINDNISFVNGKNNNALDIYDDDLVRCVEILNEITDKTIILHIRNDYEFKELCKIDDRYAKIEIFNQSFYYMLHDERLYYISENEYNIFFSNYNVVNVKQYIRDLKLKQIIL